jgi:hypothetical protein
MLTYTFSCSYIRSTELTSDERMIGCICKRYVTTITLTSINWMLIWGCIILAYTVNVEIYDYAPAVHYAFCRCISSINYLLRQRQERVLWRRTHLQKLLKLEVTIARKVLPHPQRIYGTMRNLLNKRQFIRSCFARTRYEAGWFRCIEMNHSVQFSQKHFLEIDYS